MGSSHIFSAVLLLFIATLGSLQPRIEAQGASESGYWDGRFFITDRSDMRRLELDAEGRLLVMGGMQILGSGEITQMVRWDGTAWVNLTNGSSSTVVGVQGDTTWVAWIPQNGLVVGTRSDTIPIVLPAIAGKVNAISSDGASLIVAGSFVTGESSKATNVTQWIEGAWRPMGNGLESVVTCLLTTNGVVYAGTVGSANSPTPVWRWDGQRWEGLGQLPEGRVSEVRDLAWHDGRLVIATGASGATSPAVMSWTGTDWEPHGSPMVPGLAVSLAVFRGELFAAGSFPPMGTSARRLGLLRLTSTGWDVPGVDPGLFSTGLSLAATSTELFALSTMNALVGLGKATALWQYNGDQWSLFSNGLFTTDQVEDFAEAPSGMVISGRSSQSPSTPGYHGWLWDGAYAKPLGVIPPVGNSVRMRARMITHQGKVFRHAAVTPGDVGGSSVLMRLDGTNWVSATPTFSLFPTVLESHGDAIVAAGLDGLSSTQESAVMRWSQETWSRLGDRFASTVGGGPASVDAVLSHKGRLIVGGNFGAIGERAISSLAEWDGTRWVALPDPVDGPVRGLASRGDQIVVVGSFQQAGTVRSPGIVLLTDHGPVPISQGLGMDRIQCLAVGSDGTIAVGNSGNPNAEVWLYRSGGWVRIAVAQGNSILSLRWRGRDLFAGGTFTRLGGLQSCTVGIWHEPGSYLESRRLPNGVVQLRRTGSKRGVFGIDQGEDLDSWIPWRAESLLGLTDVWMDVTPSTLGQRFYRVRGRP